MLANLPEELLETIFMQPCLIDRDLVRLKRTSKYFQELINTYSEKRRGALWRAKFLKRWPKCIPAFKRGLVTDWQKMCNIRYEMEGKTRETVKVAIQKLIQRNSVPKCILTLFGTSTEDILRPDGFIYDCVIDVLHTMVTPPDTEIDGTLSLQYYASMLMRVFKCEGLKSDWEYLCQEVYDGDLDKVPLEYGLNLIGQYLAPLDDERNQEVDRNINTLCKKIMKSLEGSHPHITKKASWRTLPFDVSESIWTEDEGNALVKALVEMMQKRVGHISAVSLEFIHQMKHNWNVPLEVNLCSMLTACMARRLGIHCDVMLRRPPNSHVILRFNNCALRESSEKDVLVDLTQVWNDRSVYISSLSIEKQLLTPERATSHIELLRYHAEGHRHSITNSVEQLRQFELRLYLDADNHSMARRVINSYLNNGVNVREAFELAKRCELEIEDQIVVAYNDHTESAEMADQLIDEVRKREDPLYSDVKYYVGMIMRHKRYGYDCVIIGWSTSCNASDRWIRQMGVDRLPLGREQPFYHVLVPDGSQRYAAQENLEYHPSPMPIEHEEVGRYLSAYRDTHYIMNYAVKRVYVDDEHFTIENARKRYKDLFKEMVDER